MSQDIALFVGGSPIGAPFKSTNKYLFATNVMSEGAQLSIPRTGASACGDDITAVIAGSANTLVAATDKYDFNSNTVRVGMALKGLPMHSVGAASNKDVGYFVGGTPSGWPHQVTDVQKLVFATEVVTSTPGLDKPTSAICGYASPTVGYFVGGFYQAEDGPVILTDLVTKIQFSTGSITKKSYLEREKGFVAASTNYRAVLTRGESVHEIPTNQTVVHEFATDTFVVSSKLSINRTHVMAAGNKERALFGGHGYECPNVKIMDSYNFVTGAVSSSTQLTAARKMGYGVSNAHGGL